LLQGRPSVVAKDAVLIIDDFRPGGAERRRLEGEADRLLRAAANGAGRGRLKSDTSLRPAHPPRALILSTGEEKPSGENLIARMLLVGVAPGDIDSKRLSACQRDAASGLYAQATAGYIRWLAPRLDQLSAEMNSAHGSYREQAAHKGLHRRTPGIVADLFLGWQRTRNHRCAKWLPQGARVVWLDGQDLFLDIDSACRAARVMASDRDAIAIGVQTLVKRLHEGCLKTIAGQRGKLKVRRLIVGRPLEVLHLPGARSGHSRWAL
jgi:hypothetical protein